MPKKYVVRLTIRERNRSGASVDWRFATSDARIKLRSLYPTVKH